MKKPTTKKNVSPKATAKPIRLTATVEGIRELEERLDTLRGALDLARNLFETTRSKLGGPDEPMTDILPGGSYYAADFLADAMGRALGTIEEIAESYDVTVTGAGGAR